MERKGSFITRHYGDAVSGQAIVSHLLENDQTVALDIQCEMVDEGLTLDQTTAGRFLQEDQIKQREKYERDLRDAEEALEDAKKEKDKALVAQFSQQTAEYKAKLEKANADTSGLSVNYSSLVEEKDTQYSTLAKEIEAEKKKREDEMRFLERNMSELQNALERQEKEHQVETRRVMRNQSAKSASEMARIQALAEQYERRQAEMMAQLTAMQEEKRRKAARDKNNILKSAFWVTIFNGLLGADERPQHESHRPMRQGDWARYPNHHGAIQHGWHQANY